MFFKIFLFITFIMADVCLEGFVGGRQTLNQNVLKT